MRRKFLLFNIADGEKSNGGDIEKDFALVYYCLLERAISPSLINRHSENEQPIWS